ncbi:MAG: hypothetical protein WCQ90_06485 [Deltaproteobacteria bacterium]
MFFDEHDPPHFHAEHQGIRLFLISTAML